MTDSDCRPSSNLVAIWRPLAALLVATLIGVGCASVEVRKLDPGDKTTTGVRFYRPKAYLLLNPDKEKGGCQASIVWLPDPSEEYVINSTAGLGSATVKAQLDSGWNLVSLNSEVDNSKIVGDISTLLAKIVPSTNFALSQQGNQPPPRCLPPAGLYDLGIPRGQGPATALTGPQVGCCD